MRALSSLAAHEPGQAVLGRKLAEATGVPASYLSKILLVLNRAGLVDATRGTGGGYRLARTPEEIPLIDIVSPFDHVDGVEDCVLGLAECSSEYPCALHEWWNGMRESYLDRLRQTSLAEASRQSHKKPPIGEVNA